MTVRSSQRTALLEKYRCINVEYDNWWDCVESDFKEDMKAVGIEVGKVYFSGFWSQGDGACFTGNMDDALVYLNHHHKDQYPMIRTLLGHGGGVYARCEHRGRCYHENCTEFWADSDTLTGILDSPTEFHDTITSRWDQELDAEMGEFEKDISNQWRTYMRELYRKLEGEYDYLTSDEAVWEALEANELIEDTDDEEAEAA